METTTRTRPVHRPTDLTTVGAVALYVGALLGPSLLLLPGLAATLAGPASILAWAGLLGLSALLAHIFTTLGLAMPDADGVQGYATAAFGPAVGHLVGVWFVTGVVLGAPVVAQIGGAYVADLVGHASPAGEAIAGLVLLVVVVVAGLTGRTVPTRIQLGLVAFVLVLVVVVAVGGADQAAAANFTPFAPHGWWAIGRAASVLMLSFVGWEAVSPLVRRLRDPRAQLPRITRAAFLVTAATLATLAMATIAILGDEAGSRVPLADLLAIAIGRPGRGVAAAAAVAFTLAATNAYLSGARELARELAPTPHIADTRLRLAIAAAAVLVFGAGGPGWVPLSLLVALPTTLFVAVYAATAAAAVRLTSGWTRVAARVAMAIVLAVLGSAGWALAGLVAVTSAAVCIRREA